MNDMHEMTSNDFIMAVTYSNYKNYYESISFMSHQVILSPCCIILQVDIVVSSDSLGPKP